MYNFCIIFTGCFV